ncbi:MAG: hypothetical protein AAF050_24325 [Cyanobacteria bacterium J06649_5]
MTPKKKANRETRSAFELSIQLLSYRASVTAQRWARFITPLIAPHRIAHRTITALFCDAKQAPVIDG